jgi:uncharacterized membrane protein
MGALPRIVVMTFVVTFGAVANAHATVLQAPPDAPLWAHVGAAALLWMHIIGGGAGIATGAIAIASRKGGKIHRAVGRVFFWVMLVCYIVAACVAPFLDDGQRPNTIAGVMALYLLLTGWAAAQRPEIKAGVYQGVGLVAALTIAGSGALFMKMGAESPTGTIDGSPPEAFVVFMMAGLFAAGGEIHVLVRRTLSGPARIARHLWRMCFSLFIASGSFFLGQMQVLPAWIRESALPYLLALAPLAAMLVWLALVRIPRRRKAVPAAE